MKRLLFSLFLFLLGMVSFGRDTERQYMGIVPSVLFEPYDSYDAVELNILPFSYEGVKNQGFNLQLRSILNLRIIENHPLEFSHCGGTLAALHYFDKDFFSITPALGPFVSYTWNLADKQNTITVGAEAGFSFSPLNHYLLMINIQPGINWYPDERSRDLANAEWGFLPHFGILVQFGREFI